MSMRWKLLITPLVMATGLALAQDPPEPAPDAADAAVQSQSEAAEDDSSQGGQDDALQPQAEEAGQDTGTQDPGTQALAQDPGKGAEIQTASDQGPKMVSGMSILGNQEAPKSLVIVPWKSSEIGDSIGISTVLDDSRQPIDREVFLRELSYYEIRSEKKP